MNLSHYLARNLIEGGGMPGVDLSPSTGFGGTISGLSNSDIFGGLGVLSGGGLTGFGLTALGVALDQASSEIAGHPEFGMAETSFGQGLANALSMGLFGQSIADQAMGQGYGSVAVDLNSYGALNTPDLASSVGFGGNSSGGLSGFGGSIGDIDVDSEASFGGGIDSPL